MPVPGGTTWKSRKRLLAPAQERVALAVALELELDVAGEGAAGAEDVDLHRVVDDELDRDQRVDLRRVAAEVGHRVAHRREVDDGRDAGEVLEQDARGRKEISRLGSSAGDPAGDRLDVVVASPFAEHVLEQDPQRVGEPRDVPLLLERVEPVDLDAASPTVRVERAASSSAMPRMYRTSRRSPTWTASVDSPGGASGLHAEATRARRASGADVAGAVDSCDRDRACARARASVSVGSCTSNVRAPIDPVGAEAAGIVHRRPGENGDLGRALDRDAGDRGRVDGVQNEPSLLVDHAGAGA